MAGRSALNLIEKDMQDEEQNWWKSVVSEYRRNGNVKLELNLPRFEYSRIRSMFELVVKDAQEDAETWGERNTLRSATRKVVQHILFAQAQDLIELRKNKSAEELYTILMRNQQSMPIIDNGSTDYKYKEDRKTVKIPLRLPYMYELELEYTVDDVCEHNNVLLTVERALEIQFSHFARKARANDVIEFADAIIQQILKRGA